MDQARSIIAHNLDEKLKNLELDSAVKVVIAVSGTPDLEAKLDSLPLPERIRESHLGYMERLKVLEHYLAERGITTTRMGECPWFVSATLTKKQILELAVQQDAPILQIVSAEYLVQLEYACPD